MALQEIAQYFENVEKMPVKCKLPISDFKAGNGWMVNGSNTIV